MNKKFSLRARLRSFVYAGRGVGLLVRGEHNAWIHLVATVLVVAAGFMLRIERWEWVAITICIGLVLMAEALNSAVEKLCDFLCPEHDVHIGAVKDLAAAGVLFAAVAAAAAGLVIFIPRIMELI